MSARTTNPGRATAAATAGLCVVAAAMFFLPGCPYDDSPPQPQSGPADGSAISNADGDSRTVIPGQGFIFEIVLKTAVVEVPAGTISASEDIWSYVDEEPISGRASGLLGRNGIRAGIGADENWPRVATVLNHLAGRPFKHTISTLYSGDKTSLLANVYDQPQTIFMFRDNLTLTGADYPAGEYSLNIAAWLDQDDPGRLILAICPRVISSKREPQFIQGPNGLEMVTRPAEFILDQVSFHLAMKAGEFLIIGPGWQAAKPDSLGRAFFTRKTNDIRMETVYIIVPEIKRRPLRMNG